MTEPGCHMHYAVVNDEHITVWFCGHNVADIVKLRGKWLTVFDTYTTNHDDLHKAKLWVEKHVEIEGWKI